ncbi:FAD-dependent oxidoreductase [Alsobacter sp. SYSU M60028]|uniref:FAD-dependent oxidoreductase n=1 Tax=Alsobacter ponti TaxID=2962936 RepID=A0ABT1LFK0_9HYPH|nr:FAD-dependent oxidoreductase [Alsobacter ponti]MCP8940209.1 FAD-dependent oxidoreductase [Alsobacter ponti]
MKSHARAVVIGGGVVGASVLYHLTKVGWKDVMLIERSELTSGSTWHAAGGMHTINGDPNVAKLQQYTINLYKEIEAISGQSCGVHLTGGLMLAGTRERMDWLKMVHARGRYLGMELDLLSIEEAHRLFPLMDPKYFVGALYDPIEGHVDPWGVTSAYAKSAQIGGAEVVRHNRVTGLAQRADGTWTVSTEQGEVHAEHVVNAGGLWAREVGRMAGLELPILAMEHQYIISEDIPELAGQDKEMLHVVDFDGEIYMRQERGGILLGTYERAGTPWSEHETPWTFGHELLPNDLDRIAPSLEVGFAHYPVLEKAGIRKVINGPFTFAPDGNPLIGPIRGLRNYWVACGVMAGFSQGGGVGLALSNWMAEGDPGFDVWAMDVARYGEWATLAYTNAKVRENYSRRFRIRFPNEELTAARPLRTTPLYDRLKAENAVFGESYGLEHPLWFAPAGEKAEEDISFRRSNAFPHVARECAAVRERVGLMETSSYAKYEVTGAGAEAFLSRIMANRMPAQGRIVLTPMLNERGKLIGDFTVGRLGPDRFLVIGSGPAETYHMRWFLSRKQDKGVRIEACGQRLQGLSVAGPRSRELLAGLTRADLSTASFPFLSIASMDIGPVPATVGRISFTGDLGYEIWVSPEYQRTLFELLREAGREFGLELFGGRALNAMRLEKSFGTWAREYRPIYGPVEAGLSRFVDLRKPDFVGRDAAAREKESGGALRLTVFQVDAADADAIGDEPVWHDGKVVGWITSGGYAHWSKASVALGYVPKALAGAPQGFEVEIIGERRKATPLARPLFDPDGARMRA